MPSNVAHKITRENKQLYVDSKNNKKTKCIKIHTDLGKPEETTANIPVENKLAEIEVYKFKCGLYTYWQKNNM